MKVIVTIRLVVGCNRREILKRNWRYIFLSGCSFMEGLGNKSCVFPVESHPFAKVAVDSDSASRFFVFNMGANGCFARTSVLVNSASKVRFHAEKDVFMALEQRYGNSYCNLIFSFAPESNARYILRGGSLVERRGGMLGALGARSSYCTVSGQAILDANERVPLSLKKFTLRPSGLACLRMRAASRWVVRKY